MEKERKEDYRKSLYRSFLTCVKDLPTAKQILKAFLVRIEFEFNGKTVNPYRSEISNSARLFFGNKNPTNR